MLNTGGRLRLRRWAGPRWGQRWNPRWKAALTAGLVWCIGAVTLSAAAADLTDDPLANSRYLPAGSPAERAAVLKWSVENRRLDMAATLIHAMRFMDPDGRRQVGYTLRRLTGEKHGASWFDWMVWLETHPEVQTFAEFDRYLAALFASLDESFLRFIYGGVTRRIRIEEVVWGGVAADGIPALDDPPLIDASEAAVLDDEETVFGVEIGGDARAYPYRYMDWHEMLNDVVGGVPVTLAYCTLCGSGILYRAAVPGSADRLVFGSSGLLYRSNKLMYDRQTHSLWNQFTGQPVVGPLSDSGLVLEVLPLLTTRWGEWRRRHPQTRVLSADTGHDRDYRPGKPYGRYFASSKLMFPTVVADDRLMPKDEVFALRVSGASRAWPLKAFAAGRVINDRSGVLDLVLVGDSTQRSVRAYRGGGFDFETIEGDPDALRQGARIWRITEAALIGPDGEQLSRLPGHLAYWFAWIGFNEGSSLYVEPEG